MDPLYKRAVINKCTQVVSELHGKVGTITKSSFTDRSESRIFYHRTKEQCPDETLYWFQFDDPIKSESHLNGWEGVWVDNTNVLTFL